MRVRAPTAEPRIPDTNLPAGNAPDAGATASTQPAVFPADLPAGLSAGMPTALPNVLPTVLPTVLHIGSGKAFRAEWLNLDCNPTWNPDLVADLERPIAAGTTFETVRFGTIELRPGMFERIVAHDVLEHVRDLTTCMTTCRDLLADGGVFEIQVPYDLSHGAWQDPTHVRAFNERSWLYYGEWCWYLDWFESYLPTQKLDLRLSPLGTEMLQRGASQDEIARTPRAVDAMSVELVKQPVPEAIRAQQSARGTGSATLPA